MIWLGMRPTFQGWNNLFSTLILLPNPSLIFEENLTRQGLAFRLPREILWKQHLRYLITEMRLETSERPSSWWLPWGHLPQLQDGPDNNTHLQGPASSATRQDIGKNIALHLTHYQDPVHNVAKVDTERMTAPLCLCKVGQSPTPTLNRVKALWTSWAWWQKTDGALGPWPP
jgi:hypothetical protein